MGTTALWKMRDMQMRAVIGGAASSGNIIGADSRIMVYGEIIVSELCVNRLSRAEK